VTQNRHKRKKKRKPRSFYGSLIFGSVIGVQAEK